MEFNLIIKDFNLYNVYAAYQDAKYNLEQARLRLAETNAKYVGMDCNAAEIFAVKLAKQAVVKQYQEAGYLPAIKMSMIEEKVISKLLDEKLGK